MRAIVYTSVVAEGLPPGKLAEVLTRAIQHNQMAGVTGVLLHDGGRFIQYLEGPDDGISSALGRIMTATSHRDITVLDEGTVAVRLFPNWAMRDVALGRLEITDITRANWKDALTGEPKAEGALTGLQLMLAHVSGLG